MGLPFLNTKDNSKGNTIVEESNIASATSLTSGVDDITHLMYMSTYINGNYIPDGIISLNEKSNKLGLSWAKLSPSWGLKLEFEVVV